MARVTPVWRTRLSIARKSSTIAHPNGTDAFGLTKIEVADDPTLRKGDMIATEQGLDKFNGSSRAVARASNGQRATPIR